MNKNKKSKQSKKELAVAKEEKELRFMFMEELMKQASEKGADGVSDAIYDMVAVSLWLLCSLEISTARYRVCEIWICWADVAEVASVCQWLNLTSWCVESKEVIGWHDSCMLRYSDKDIFGVLDQSVDTYLRNMNNVFNISQFCQTLGNLLGSLKTEASVGALVRKLRQEKQLYQIFFRFMGSCRLLRIYPCSIASIALAR
ncbi:hypothetical protein Droror1_Dr00002356 [Drosera rotundifolia]